MENYDWETVAAQLTRLLRLQTPPIAMKWIETEEELQKIPKLRIHDKHLPPCTIVGHAAQYNWTSACRSENIHANYCRGINGMFCRDDKWFSGGMFNGVWFNNLDASKAHNLALNCIPPKYIAVVASPLTAGRIQPDVCVLYVSPAQAFLLLAGYQFEHYEKLDFTFVGESTCSDSWCRTFLTGKPSIGLPCYADKKFAGMGENELRLTFTPQGLVRAVEGLEGLHKNGLRYPIASYSLTTDILDGLPKSYLEY
jgi:uncharacterized protein (DUF169 family)